MGKSRIIFNVWQEFSIFSNTYFNTCCNLNIQRDIYSAFLAGSIENDEPTSRFILDTADVPLSKGGEGGLLNVGGVWKLFSSGRCPPHPLSPSPQACGEGEGGRGLGGEVKLRMPANR
jgi:hypothetical protein